MINRAVSLCLRMVEIVLFVQPTAKIDKRLLSEVKTLAIRERSDFLVMVVDRMQGGLHD